MKCCSLSVVVELEKMGLSLDWWFPLVDGVTRECFKEHVERDYPDSARRLLELWDRGVWDSVNRVDARCRQFDVAGVPLSLGLAFSEWCSNACDAYELVTNVRHALDVLSIMFPELPAPWAVADCLKGYVHFDRDFFRGVVALHVPESVMIPLLVCRMWAAVRSMEPMTCVAMVRSHIELMADCFASKDEERNEENE